MNTNTKHVRCYRKVNKDEEIQGNGGVSHTSTATMENFSQLLGNRHIGDSLVQDRVDDR